MSKLLSANFTRLFKNLFFKICMIFSAGLGILFDMARYIDIQENQEIYSELGTEYKSADGFAFSGALYLVFVVAAFVGLFIGTEYSDGTIRNKLMIGHKRIEIYFANFIVCSVANILILLSFIICTLVLGIIIFHAQSLTINQTLLSILMQCITMVGFSAILVLISMLIQSKSGSSVTALIMTVVMFFAAMTISNKLQAPEYYEDMEMYTSETGEVRLETVETKNPAYITGTKREIYEFLNNILPFNQFYQITLNNMDNVGKMVVYSALIIILTNGTGIVLFRKKDLK